MDALDLAPPDPSDASAEWLLPGDPLDASIEFFEQLGFRLLSLRPADSPREALLVGRGLRLRLDREHHGEPGSLRVLDPALGTRERRAPNGTRVLPIDPAAEPVLPPFEPRFSLVSRAESPWGVGRAGMEYRDLIPGRCGGRCVASHIRIREGGPVPDRVHHHAVRFQMIFGLAGRVRVAYQDQGPAFELEPGDLILQAPGIRHRVLDCSDGLEVLEVGTPADHETHFDDGLVLPDPIARADRRYGGQRFVRARASQRVWSPGEHAGVEVCELGVAAATGGLASVRVLRVRAGAEAPPFEAHLGELSLRFGLAGQARLDRVESEPRPFGAGDCLVVPAGLDHRLLVEEEDCEWLEIRLPAFSQEPPADRPEGAIVAS